MNILNKDNLQQFLTDLNLLPEEVKIFLHFALFCGMRRSEIYGLTPKDISLDFKTVSINKSRHRIKGEWVIKDTKTKSSYRIISLPDFMLEEIKPLMNREYLFDFMPDYLEKQFRTMTKEKGYSITIHALRHSHASMLHDSGITLAEISKQLGHSDISTTLSIYTHIFNESNNKIANIINEMSPKSHQEEKEAL